MHGVGDVSLPSNVRKAERAARRFAESHRHRYMPWLTQFVHGAVRPDSARVTIEANRDSVWVRVDGDLVAIVSSFSVSTDIPTGSGGDLYGPERDVRGDIRDVRVANALNEAVQRALGRHVVDRAELLRRRQAWAASLAQHGVPASVSDGGVVVTGIGTVDPPPSATPPGKEAARFVRDQTKLCMPWLREQVLAAVHTDSRVEVDAKKGRLRLLVDGKHDIVTVTRYSISVSDRTGFRGDLTVDPGPLAGLQDVVARSLGRDRRGPRDRRRRRRRQGTFLSRPRSSLPPHQFRTLTYGRPFRTSCRLRLATGQ